MAGMAGMTGIPASSSGSSGSTHNGSGGHCLLMSPKVSSPESEVKFVSKPDQAVDGSLHNEDVVVMELTLLTLLMVLVVDRTDELGDRFFDRGA
jgi:hypothetical protein